MSAPAAAGTRSGRGHPEGLAAFPGVLRGVPPTGPRWGHHPRGGLRASSLLWGLAQNGLGDPQLCMWCRGFRIPFWGVAPWGVPSRMALESSCTKDSPQGGFRVPHPSSVFTLGVPFRVDLGYPSSNASTLEVPHRVALESPLLWGFLQDGFAVALLWGFPQYGFGIPLALGVPFRTFLCAPSSS